MTYREFSANYLRTHRPKSFGGGPAVMREMGAVWRAQKGGRSRRNPRVVQDNPRGGLGTLLLWGAVAYVGYQFIRGQQAAATPTPAG